MSHKPWVLLSLIAALSVSAHSATAEAGFTQVEFLDENGDGVITTEEFEAHVLDRWSEDDLNSDGKVTRTELKTKLEQRRAQRFRHIDGNTNGVVERSEARQLPDELFTRLDIDRSGTLSQVEFDNVPMLGAATAGMVGPLPGDEDRDDVITRAEAQTMAQEMSTHLDTNGDGVLNRKELGRRGAPITIGSSTLSS